MIVEVRIFTCNPGLLPALKKQFKTRTLAIWKKHGIRQIGFWTVLIGDGSNDLHCALAWKSMAERERKWAKFRADPAWRKVRAETEKDGPIIANINSVFLRPTDFSALK